MIQNALMYLLRVVKRRNSDEQSEDEDDGYVVPKKEKQPTMAFQLEKLYAAMEEMIEKQSNKISQYVFLRPS